MKNVNIQLLQRSQNSALLHVILFIVGIAMAAVAQERPNIILMMADDMGFSDIAPYGGEVMTPNLDSLAAGGVRFTQFYNTGRCCPTRATLLTGLYAHQAGMGHMTSNNESSDGPGFSGGITSRCMTIAEVLKTAGYATYVSGKWHVVRNGNITGTNKENWPPQRGFDRSFGIITGACNYYSALQNTTNSLATGNTIINAHDNFYFTDDISDTAVKYINEHAVSDTSPFFMYVAFTSPHWPLHAHKQDIDKYRDRYTDGWDALRAERYARMKDMGLIKNEWDLSPRNAPAWDAQGQSLQTEMALRMAIYAAQIDCMDQGIGRIMDALKANNLWENTLIVFIADNGGCAEGGNFGQGPAAWLETERGYSNGDTYTSYGKAWANASNTPFRMFKHYVHEGGISSPLIAHWPAGITHREEWETQPGHLIDLMTTFVDVAGAEYPRAYKGNLILPMEGTSLVPAFSGEDVGRQNPIFWEHEGNRAVRDGKWKLVAQGESGAWQLYDMDADRTELNNLAAANTAKRDELAALYDAWAERAFAIRKTDYDLPPTLELVYPNGGESFVKDDEVEIVWGTIWTDITNVKLEYNAGSGWETIIESTEHDGSYTWTVPELESDQVKIRVTSGNGQLTDESDGSFAILPVRRGTVRGPTQKYFLTGRKGSHVLLFPEGDQAEQLIISDVKGSIIRELELSSNRVEWDETDRNGAQIPQGVYVVTLHGKTYRNATVTPLP